MEPFSCSYGIRILTNALPLLRKKTRKVAHNNAVPKIKEGPDIRLATHIHAAIDVQHLAGHII